MLLNGRVLSNYIILSVLNRRDYFWRYYLEGVIILGFIPCIILESPNVNMTIKRYWCYDWVLRVPWDLTRGLIFAKIWLQHCCCVTSLSVIDVYLSVSWACIDITLACCLWRWEVAFYVHVLHVMTLEGENWSVILNLLLSLSLWIVLSWEIEFRTFR